MYECFHCGVRSVMWDRDFTFYDFGYDGNGVVHTLHCMNCGAEIEYRVKDDTAFDDRSSGDDA